MHRRFHSTCSSFYSTTKIYDRFCTHSVSLPHCCGHNRVYGILLSWHICEKNTHQLHFIKHFHFMWSICHRIYMYGWTLRGCFDGSLVHLINILSFDSLCMDSTLRLYCLWSSYLWCIHVGNWSRNSVWSLSQQNNWVDLHLFRIICRSTLFGLRHLTCGR